MDHPLAPPADALRPWRATALVASVVAAVELVALTVVGAAFLGKSLTHPKPKAERIVRTAAPVVPHRAVKTALAVAPKLTRHQTSVLVLNGNGVSGAAGAAAARVSGLGYTIRSVGNATHPSTGPTIVMYRPGFQGEGLRLARDLHVTAGPLDGLRPGELLGAKVALVVGS